MSMKDRAEKYAGISVILFFASAHGGYEYGSEPSSLGDIFLAFILWGVVGFVMFGGYEDMISPGETTLDEEVDLSLMIYIKKYLLYVCCVSAPVYVIQEINVSAEVLVARAERSYAEEKSQIEKAYAQKIKEAKAKIRLAEIEIERRSLYEPSLKSQQQSEELKVAHEKLKTLQNKGVDYTSLKKLSSAPPDPHIGEKKLILSGLWLGICFFLQRIFEKYFHDKGYALLAVCAVGFIIAFFTANYFLLGGSVTGGLMGSVGDRS